jgi:hypothetical protein
MATVLPPPQISLLRGINDGEGLPQDRVHGDTVPRAPRSFYAIDPWTHLQKGRRSQPHSSGSMTTRCRFNFKPIEMTS